MSARFLQRTNYHHRSNVISSVSAVDHCEITSAIHMHGMRRAQKISQNNKPVQAKVQVGLD